MNVLPAGPKLLPPAFVLPYVFLPACWPFINFLNVNGELQFSVLRVGVYFLCSIAVFMLALVLAKIILGRWLDWSRLASIGAVAIICFFGYGVVGSLAGLLWDGYVLTSWFVVTSVLLALAFFLSRTTAFRHVVLIFCITLVGVPGVSYGIFLVQSPPVAEKSSAARNDDLAQLVPIAKGSSSEWYELREVSQNPVAERPSVYLIILDTYARADVLKSRFGFDNSGFLDKLRSRGFLIADWAHSNYRKTDLSVPSMLAMNYIFNNQLDEVDTRVRALSAWSGNSELYRWFHDAGYYVAFLHPLGQNCASAYLDYCHVLPLLRMRELEFDLLFLTPLVPITRLIFSHAFESGIGLELPEANTFVMELKTKKPVFAYIHVLLPHPPGRYAPDCSRTSYGPSTEGLAGGSSHQGYLGNLQCVNRQTITLIESIVDRDPGAIIIVQGDHGIHWELHKDTLAEDVSNKDIVKNFGILNAFRIPQSPNCNGALYSGISSVNTFRFIFRCLGLSYIELLPDKIFWGNQDQGRAGFEELPVETMKERFSSN